MVDDLNQARQYTAKRLLLDALLLERTGLDLAAHVARLLDAGDGWRPIASTIGGLAGIEVSHVSLYLWFAREAA